MEYVIGIDGGGTKTHLIAADRKMNILYESYGGSSNLTSLPGNTVREHLTALIQSFFAKSGLQPDNCICLYLGSAGAGRESACCELREILENLMPHCNVHVSNDAEGALAGGSESGSGILLIAGTGSFCYGKNSLGGTCRAGGWGHVMGDEGSGYEMSCEILRAVAKAHDGRGDPTALTALVMEHWRLTGMDGLMDSVYRSGKGKSELASLAFLCDIAYDKGDKIAYQIMEKAAAALSVLVKAVSERLQGDREQLPCSYTGGLLTKSRYLKVHLEKKLLVRCPGVELLPCKHNAAWGCAALAWRAIQD